MDIGCNEIFTIVRNGQLAFQNLTFVQLQRALCKSIPGLSIVEMHTKNKVHVSVIQVRDGNEIPNSEPPTEEEGVIEPRSTTGKKN